MPTILQTWCDLIDKAGQSSNEITALMERTFKNGNPPEVAIADALRSIAAQLAYGNTLAAASFFMEHFEDSAEEDAGEVPTMCQGCGHDTPGHHEGCPWL